MLPIAPFSKFAGPSPSLQPWQDGAVRIDGALAEEGCSVVRQSGLLEACALLGGASGPRSDANGAPAVLSTLAAASGAATIAAAASPEDAAAQLSEAQAEVLSWKRSYAELFEKAVTALGREARAV